jgi:hypothetical protein
MGAVRARTRLAGRPFRARDTGVIDMGLGVGEPVYPHGVWLPVWLSGLRCNGSETTLAECQGGRSYGPRPDSNQAYGKYVYDNRRVHLLCSDQEPPPTLSVRLTGSPVPYIGRLEVRTYGVRLCGNLP